MGLSVSCGTAARGHELEIPAGPSPSLTRSHAAGQLGRQERDTAAGCRIRAEEDLRQAGSMDTDQGRRKFEHSAASWTARGDLLQRLEASFKTRGTRQPG